MNENKSFYVEIGLAVLVLVGAGFLATKARAELESHTLTTKLVDQVLVAETKTQSSTTATQLQKVRDLWASKSKSETVTEVFDPVTGKLVSRKHEKSTGSKSKSKTSVLTATLTAKQKASALNSSRTKEQATASTTVYASDKRSGTNFGIMATSEGVGPAVGINVVSFKPVHVDVVTAMVPMPKLGVGIAVEPFPRLSVGVAGVLTLPGDRLGAYHPALPVVGVAPALTAQYRF